jgi:ankyrin repeat protein
MKNIRFGLLIVITAISLQSQSNARDAKLSDDELKMANLIVLHNNKMSSDEQMEDLYAQELPLHKIILNQGYTTKEKLSLIQGILDSKSIDINAQDADGRTALNLMIFYKGDPAIAQLLIDYKADVNKPDRFNESPLHNAIASEAIAIAKMLLKANANPSLKNDRLETPMSLARSPKTRALFGFE